MRFHCYNAALMGLVAVFATPGLTQTTPAADDSTQGTEQIEEIVVTGSRLATGFDTPTPVAMFDAATLVATAPSNMGEALGQLPSLSGSVQNTTSGGGSGNGGVNGQNLLNLRQLGPNRTLILLDGQRMGVTNVVNSVDINIIPQTLVKRVDIVTGGASASYGSDAVAGVVNFILDTTFQGLKFDVNGGITSRNDAENGRASVAFGRALGERARMIGGVEYFKMNGFKYGEEIGREWFDHPTGAWPNPVANTTPTILQTYDARSEYGTFGGTITAVQGCPSGATGDACRSFVNQKFLPGGAIAPFVFGTNHAGFAGGGDGVPVNQPFTPNAERKGVFLHGEFDANPSLTLWAQGSFNQSDTFLQAQVASQLATTQFTIQENNAYLPAAINSVFAATPGAQTFSLTRYDRDMGFQEVTGNTEVKRYATGLKGRINDTWSYDTTLGYQDTHQQLYIRNTILRNLYAAADAVVNPANGQIVCRSTIYATPTSTTPVAGGTGMDAGCVPMNLFGDGSVSQAATDYVWGLNTADVHLKQTTADANLRGNFGDRFSLGAGPIGFAMGLNYRRTAANREVDPLSAIYIDGTGVRGFPSGLQARYGGYQYYNPAPLKGTVDAKEGYMEFGVPLLSDLPLVQSLDTTLAGRLTDYSQSGVENMWKLGLNWTLNSSVRVRGTLSADTRAPSVLELFNTTAVTQGRNTVPYASSPVAIRSSGQNVTTGNPDLDPERARTYTAGFVFSPDFVPGLQTSIDWYRISIDGSIGPPGNQQIVDACYFGNQEYCKLILVNGQAVTTTAGITAADFVVVTNPTLNLGNWTTSGVDLEAAYKFSLGAGDLALRLNANYLLDLDNDGGECPAGSAGSDLSPVGAISNSCGLNPKIKGRISANYDIGRFGIYVQERYTGGGKIDPNFVEGVDIQFNDVPAIWYTDLTAKFKLGSWFGADSEVYGNVTNVFDKDPPLVNQSSRSWVEMTEPDLYDALGRRYVLGLRVTF